ncbi:MAG: hypothetical protein DWP98_13950 [Bacteroidetes bacterium]|nr:MAG: hypothetical protein DWP98_13950 [Bacteroidota bacterium]MBL1144178.1 hypothetical protein [Bacteroidota bacterium]MCB0803548.1 DUF2007 domain-containing protein [Flavobacteriales bacterium]NOG56974.1 hypothetical protein [Bacteroidota bacterium]
MAEDWVKVYSTDVSYLAELIKYALEEENVSSVILNKRDSSHVHLFNGQVELYVHPDDVIRAKHLIDKNEL